MEGRKGKNLEKIFIENILKRPWKNGVNEGRIISNFFLLHHLAWTLWSFHHQFLVYLRWWKELLTLKLIKEGKKGGGGGGGFLRHKETGINIEGKKRITLTIQCSTEAPWLWIQREKERKKETSIIHLCVAFIIGKRECCFFIIEKEKGSRRKQVFSSSVLLYRWRKKIKGRSSLKSSRILVPFLTFFLALLFHMEMELTSPKEYKTEIPYSYIDGDLWI